MTKVVRFRWLGIGHLWVNIFSGFLWPGRKSRSTKKKKQKKKKKKKKQTNVKKH